MTRHAWHALRVLALAITAVAAIVLGMTAAPISAPARAANNGADSQSGALKRFHAYYVSFRYPAGWQAGIYPDDTSNFSHLIVFLGPQPLHDPCVTYQGPQVFTKVCSGWPIDYLARHSLLVGVWDKAWIRWTLARAKGKLVRVGGHRAKLNVTHDTCGIGANVDIDVVIPRAAGAWYEFRACIRGPGTDHFKQQVGALLASIHFGPRAILAR